MEAEQIGTYDIIDNGKVFAYLDGEGCEMLESKGLAQMTVSLRKAGLWGANTVSEIKIAVGSLNGNGTDILFQMHDINGDGIEFYRQGGCLICAELNGDYSPITLGETEIALVNDFLDKLVEINSEP